MYKWFLYFQINFVQTVPTKYLSNLSLRTSCKGNVFVSFFPLWTPRINYCLLLCNNNPYSYKDYDLLQTKQCSYLQSFFVSHVSCTSAPFCYMLSGLWAKQNSFFFFFLSVLQVRLLFIHLSISVLVLFSAALWQLICAQIRNCQRLTEEAWSNCLSLWWLTSDLVGVYSFLASLAPTLSLFLPCAKCYCKVIWANVKVRELYS